METLEHLAVGTVVSLLALGALVGFGEPIALAALLAYGIVLSTLIDLDHFLIARLRVGDWRHLRSVLAEPRNGLRGQEWIFEDVEIERDRLASHVVVGSALTAVGWLVAPVVAAFTAIVLLAHVGCDLLRDSGIA